MLPNENPVLQIQYFADLIHFWRRGLRNPKLYTVFMLEKSDNTVLVENISFTFLSRPKVRGLFPRPLKANKCKRLIDIERRLYLLPLLRLFGHNWCNVVKRICDDVNKFERNLHDCFNFSKNWKTAFICQELCWSYKSTGISNNLQIDQSINQWWIKQSINRQGSHRFAKVSQSDSETVRPSDNRSDLLFVDESINLWPIT